MNPIPIPRFDWLVKWDERERKFKSFAHTQVMVFFMFAKRGYAQMGKRGWGHRFETALPKK